MDINSEPELSTTNFPGFSSGPRPVSSSSANAFSLRDLLSTVFFYRRTAIVIALAITLLAVLLAVLLPPSFTAQARVLTLSAGVYDMQARQGASPPDDSAAAVNVEMQLLASSELHRSIARTALGPSATPDDISQWVRRFEAHLHLSRIESSNVIELNYSDRNPEGAASALRLLLAGYFTQRADVLTSGRVGFLTVQRDKARAQLDDVDAQISAYEQQKGVVNVGEQVNGAVQLDNRLREQQQAAEASLADSQKNVKVLITNEKEVPKEVELYTDNSEAAHTLGTMQTTLLQLEAKRADLASRYLAGSPFVMQADAQIHDLKATIAAQEGTLASAHRTGYNTNRDIVQDQLISAEANLAGATARRNTLNAQVAASSSRLKSLVSVSDTLTELHTQHDLLEDAVKNYSQQVELARVEQNQATTAGTTNVRVIEAPVDPSRPNNPPLLIIAAGLVSALLISAVSVFLLSSLRETFLSPQEAERALGLPVLCAIPKTAESDPAVRRFFGPVVAAISGQPARAGGGKVVLLLTPAVKPGLELPARGLLAALEARAPGRNVLLQMVNGPAVVGSKTLSVEAPREEIAGALAHLRGAFNCVLLTAPPVSNSFESVELSSQADVVLLVIQAETTRKAVAESVIAQVEQMGAHVAGVVLTGRRYHIPKWAYRLALSEGSLPV